MIEGGFRNNTKPFFPIMAYENRECPCGGKKERETMLCQACQETFHDTVEVAALNQEWPVEARRNAAIRLLSMARRRKSMSLPLIFPES
jgi:hypothetical protein